MSTSKIDDTIACIKIRYMQNVQFPARACAATDFLQISPPYRIETKRQNCYYQILRKQKGARGLKRCNENSMIHWLRNLVCGVLIGAGAILPGVSGGVLAVVFDIYRPFMEVLTHPSTALPKYWRWLPPLGIGWCIGFLGLARGISASMDWSDAVTTWLFIGLIVGTIPSLFREAGKEGRSPWAWLSMVLCAAAVFFGLFYVQHVLKISVEPNFWWYNFCGVLWGMGIVIPGMTSSSVMMALGLYQPMMDGLARHGLSGALGVLAGTGHYGGSPGSGRYLAVPPSLCRGVSRDLGGGGGLHAGHHSNGIYRRRRGGAFRAAVSGRLCPGLCPGPAGPPYPNIKKDCPMDSPFCFERVPRTTPEILEVFVCGFAGEELDRQAHGAVFLRRGKDLVDILVRECFADDAVRCVMPGLPEDTADGVDVFFEVGGESLRAVRTISSCVTMCSGWRGSAGRKEKCSCGMQKTG